MVPKGAENVKFSPALYNHTVDFLTKNDPKMGVEQHGRPMVRTMIWTNNPLDESGRCLCFTETTA